MVIIIIIIHVSHPGANVTHVYGVVVSTAVGVFICVIGILPGLLQPKNKNNTSLPTWPF